MGELAEADGRCVHRVPNATPTAARIRARKAHPNTRYASGASSSVSITAAAMFVNGAHQRRP
jgi:hypothetical protein